MKQMIAEPGCGLGWTPLVAAAACLLLIYYPEPGLLRETTFWQMFLSLAVVVIGLLSARRTGGSSAIRELSTGAKWVLLIPGTVLTAALCRQRGGFSNA